MKNRNDIRIVAQYLLDTSEAYFNLACEDILELSDSEFKKLLKEAKNWFGE